MEGRKVSSEIAQTEPENSGRLRGCFYASGYLITPVDKFLGLRVPPGLIAYDKD